MIVPMGTGVNDRATPRALFDEQHAIHHFTLDAAASHENALLERYCTLDGTFALTTFGRRIELVAEGDGLTSSWAGYRVYCNPPYGRGLLEPFVAKAAMETRTNGCPLVVMLLPVRTEQGWFHRYVWDVAEGAPREGVEINFLPGRLKYDGLAAGAPFPSMLVTWHQP